MKIFISYCHKQAAWVQDELLPVLDASGHTALIDRRRFTADEQLLTQMDHLQDEADHQLLLLSPDYLASENCRHELNRAIGRPLTVAKLAPCDLPVELGNPLYLEFHAAADLTAQWEVFARTFEIDWKVQLYAWIKTRKDILRHLESWESVNLIVQDTVVRRAMLNSLLHCKQLEVRCVDFGSPQTTTLEGAVQAILEAANHAVPAVRARTALMTLGQAMNAQTKPSIQIWEHFDDAQKRARKGSKPSDFGRDFFSAVRHLTTPTLGQPRPKKLVLLLATREEVEPWMKATYDLSTADFKTLWLN